MSINYLGKRREALSLTSEQYKKMVREFLEQSGFSLLTDSSIEGHLADMVMIHPDRSIKYEYWVECKATSIYPNEKGFIQEIMDYFLEWINKPKSDRFKLIVFAIKLKNQKEFEKIFGSKYTKKNLLDWYQDNLEVIDDNKKELLKNIDNNDIISFFSNIDFNEADKEYLHDSIVEKNNRSIFSLTRYSEKLLKESQRLSTPIQESSELFSNLLKLEIPSKYYIASTIFTSKLELYEYFEKQNIEIIPILFYPEKMTISTFVPIENENPLRKIITNDPEIILITKETSQAFIISLINQHLRRIFWKKGLRRISNTNIYFFETDNKYGEEPLDKIVHVFDREKTVVKVYKKEGDVGVNELNFVFHHSVELKSKHYWGNHYIQITPNKTYTNDGKELIEGHKKDTLDRYFRNPIYNRNSNRLSEIKFWKDFIIEKNNYVKDKEKWFDLFIFGELESIMFDFQPRTVNRSQTRIGEY